VIGGIMEHIEEAGCTRATRACSLPPHTLDRDEIIERDPQRQTLAMAKALTSAG
jgi:carbamoyl-phosphate synthase large subunit